MPDRGTLNTQGNQGKEETPGTHSWQQSNRWDRGRLSMTPGTEGTREQWTREGKGQERDTQRDLVMLNTKLTNNSKMKWLFTERGSKEILECFMLACVDKLYGGADLLFPKHMSTVPKLLPNALMTILLLWVRNIWKPHLSV